MTDNLETLKQHIYIIENRKPIEKKLSRAKIINRVDGTSDIRTYYQTIIIQNKPRKSDYIKLRKTIKEVIKTADESDLMKFAKHIIEFKNLISA